MPPTCLRLFLWSDACLRWDVSDSLSALLRDLPGQVQSTVVDVLILQVLRPLLELLSTAL